MKIVAGILTEDMLRKEDILLYDIQKSEVTQQDYTRANALLSALNNCGKHGRGKIGLSFHFDDEAREIYEIPEVVSYVKRLFSDCPHFAYFLLPDQAALQAFICCLSGAKVEKAADGVATVAVDSNTFLANINAIESSVLSYGKSIGDADGAKRLLQQMGF